MKTKVIKEVIPKHTVEKEVYVCETCGTEYNRTYHLDKCSICNKEVCNACKRVLYISEDYLTYDKEDPASIDFDTEDNPGLRAVCNDCYVKVIAGQESYSTLVGTLVNEFNSRLKQLNDMYLEGKCK